MIYYIGIHHEYSIFILYSTVSVIHQKKKNSCSPLKHRLRLLD
jgi:hypothetical protein